jgi:outer membrane protein assembly factor BamD (BamD/ComL family)
LLPEKRKHIVFYKLIFPFLAILFYSASVWPAEEEGGVYVDETLQMKLADHFFEEGDYYRAITEYKRFLFFFSSSARTEEANGKIVKSYYKGKRWDEAIRAGNDFLIKFPSSEWTSEVLLMQGRCYIEKMDYSQARKVFQKILETETVNSIRDEAQWQIAITYLKEERWKEAASEFRKTQKNSHLFPKSEYLAQSLDRVDKLPYKSPTTAGVLAILPGAGHLYCERYRDAAIAFLLNGAFIWGMVESFQHENYVVGGILTFFELGWYSGNIYSAVSSAHKFNRKTKKEYLEHMEKESSLGLGFSWHEGKPIFALRYDF